VYLKLTNIDPRDHEIKEEMKRLQAFHLKLTEAKVMNTNTNTPGIINKEACDQMIKALIGSSNIRKVKKSVPVPETLHIDLTKKFK